MGNSARKRSSESVMGLRSLSGRLKVYTHKGILHRTRAGNLFFGASNLARCLALITKGRYNSRSQCEGVIDRVLINVDGLVATYAGTTERDSRTVACPVGGTCTH